MKKLSSMYKDIFPPASPFPQSWYAIRWLRPQEEDRLTAWRTRPEKEAQALVKQAIQRDPEPQYRMADLAASEEHLLGELGITSGFIPNSSRTSVYWYKHGTVIRYAECLM